MNPFSDILSAMTTSYGLPNSANVLVLKILRDTYTASDYVAGMNPYRYALAVLTPYRPNCVISEMVAGWTKQLERD